jgi:TPR repeat protein
LKGVGVDADPATARDWFGRAHEAGHAEAGAAASSIRRRRNPAAATRGD